MKVAVPVDDAQAKVLGMTMVTIEYAFSTALKMQKIFKRSIYQDPYGDVIEETSLSPFLKKQKDM